ncbi:STARD3 N-terminal-like protein [Collichthys lucidus]|uniref:STARD3 N-terminal-like protein n=1 Tax=Collichthys lucidus TaxID=240159 RepID=A0A4U5UVV9_COLLU|nr:STARD3 N-terminal-like protein [Collichthys lucidus]
MESRCSSSADSRLTARGLVSINAASICARVESYEAGEKKCISDVRRTFCLFVTFDLLFITLLWIIELNLYDDFVLLSCVEAEQRALKGGIEKQLDIEVLHYNYRDSFFDIFLLAVFRFATLILAYAVCKLRHWWAIAITTAVSCAFLIVKVILSKENEDENRYLSIVGATERAPLMGPGPLSDGQFYSPPESVADSDEELDDKHDPEKGLIQQSGNDATLHNTARHTEVKRLPRPGEEVKGGRGGEEEEKNKAPGAGVHKSEDSMRMKR